MRIFNKLVLVASAVLFASSIVQSKNIDFDPAVRVLLSKGTQVTFGRGNTPNDLPVAECIALQNSAQLNCTISFRLTDRSNDYCKLILQSESVGTTVKLDALYQLSEKKLIVIWNESTRFIKSLIARKITTVDFGNCDNSVTHSFSLNNQQELEDIILYEDAFEAIITSKHLEKFIIRYDLNGRELEKIPYVQNPSKFQREIKDIKDVLTFAEVKSEYEKQVIISARSSQFLTVCGQKNAKIAEGFGCRQVYVPNHLENKMDVFLPENVKLIAVHDFKNGGVVLFGIQDDNKLVVAEMHPNQEPMIQSYKLRWPVNKDVSVIFSFNEKIGSFTFVAQINESDHSSLLQHFDLPSKIRQYSQNIIHN